MNINYHSIWPPPGESAFNSPSIVAWPADALNGSQATESASGFLLPTESSALRSILAITDLLQDAEAVLERAAQLAKAHGIALSIAYYSQKPGLGRTQAIVRLIRRAHQLRAAYDVPVDRSPGDAVCPVFNLSNKE